MNIKSIVISVMFLLCAMVTIAACVDAENTRQVFSAPADQGRGPVGTRHRALPSERIALVIGNNAYASGMELSNPVNDARAMAATLRLLGFKVAEVEDANLTVMRDEVQSFNRRLATNPGVGLFYFAGHGIKSDSGLNYLIPVDYKLRSKNDLPHDAIDADSIRESMEKSNAALNIAILDACRNDPFKSRSAGQLEGGLAAMQARGTLIALATAPGSVALDGDGVHGVYTKYLLQDMRIPGIDVKEMFDRVGQDVARETDNQQRPWYNTSVQGSFMFVPPGTILPSATVIEPQTASNAAGFRDTGKNFAVDFAMFRDNGTGLPVQLHNGDTLHSGDGYFFHIKTGKGSANYFYLFQVDALGKLFRLFPSTQYHAGTNPVAADTRLTLPNENEVFYLDNTIGKEMFYFLASAKPVATLEQLENGTIDDIMNSGMPLRGPAGTRAKTGTVAARLGETQVEVQELRFTENLVHAIAIDHR